MFQNFYLVECIIISFICTIEFENTSVKTNTKWQVI